MTIDANRQWDVKVGDRTLRQGDKLVDHTGRNLVFVRISEPPSLTRSGKLRVRDGAGDVYEVHPREIDGTMVWKPAQ